MDRRTSAIGSALLGLLLATACASPVPVLNVTNHPVTNLKKMTLDEVRRGIVLGGARYSWMFEDDGPGRLRATQNDGRYSAVVSISFTETSYSITLLESMGLEQRGERIRSRYNRWIGLLSRNIDAELSKLAVAAI